MADHPRIGRQQPDMGLLGICLLVMDFVLPIALVPATVLASDRRSVGWKSGLSLVSLSLLPINFLALLGVAQMISGVSL